MAINNNDELNQKIAKDFDAFINAKTPIESSQLKSLSRRFESDLVTSPLRLATFYLIGAFFGYVGTLFICAQCSVGLSPLAWHTASLIHRIPDPWCPFVCGTVFGIAPFLVSLTCLTRFQHRYLLHRMWWLVILVPLAGSAGMMALESGHDLIWNLSWFFTAVTIPYIGECLMAIALRQSKWRQTA